jgi:hypothetical protein
MASVIKAVSFDAAGARALATFWAAALGWDVDEDSAADKAFAEAASAVAAEMARLEQPWATLVRREDHHAVMRDPEGNEFCAEPWSAPQPG